MSTDQPQSAISLLGTYAESDSDDDEKKQTKSAVDAISDEEADTPTPTPNTTQKSQTSSRPPSSLALEDENSRSDAEAGKKGKKRKHTQLVSYGADDIDDDESEEDEEDEENKSPDSGGVEHGKGYVEISVGNQTFVFTITRANQTIKWDNSGRIFSSPEHEVLKGKMMNSSLNVEQASSLSRSMLNKSYDEIELPPEPQGTCSQRLQAKIAELYQRRVREGLNLNNSIQHRVDFRNPSIYEKLIEFCGIDEKGTNYPPELYDPSIWGKESFYDALEKAQKSDMERREKERKERTKVEFVTGTKKSSSKTDLTTTNSVTVKTEDKKRKSKWDAEPAPSQGSRVSDSKSVSSSSNLTTSATGTKSTVIPATGNISKKTGK